MPPFKRQRVDYAQHGDDVAWRHVVHEELTLEILLRERLAQTIEGRIAWALQLQQSLLAQNEPPPETSARNEFKIAAEDALAAIEAPIDFLVHHEPEYTLLPTPTSINPSLTLLAPPSTSSRPTRTRDRPSAAAQEKLLYVTYPSSTPHRAPTLATLVCADCARSDFPSLQGLLNHARLKHSRAYGSHDECVAACAVPVRDAARAAWVRTHGIEVPWAGGAARPSLRRLFERAVGERAGEMLEAVAEEGMQEAADGEEEEEEGEGATNEEQDLSTERARHLALTLGLHKDSAGLAQFLGRAPKRRCINVYEEEEDVDVGDFRMEKGLAPPDGPRKASWRPVRRQRGASNGEPLSLEEPTEGPQDIRLPLAPVEDRTTPDNNTASRFHVEARIAVSDRSLWIPEGKRSQTFPDHTHHWQLSVDSPSYSRSLTTFTSSITITSLTDPPPPALTEPVIIPNVPFCISGTASASFLAKLTFNWTPSAAGADANPPLDVVHWVEHGDGVKLDMHKRATPVLGEEQLVDVALDRRTIFSEVKANDIPTLSLESGHGTGGVLQVVKKEKKGKIKAAEVPAYVQRLRSLVSKAPVTMKDVVTRHPPRLPYYLAPTPAAFKKLNPGRRKAIEFSIARVLRDAYHASISLKDDPKDYIPLTAADIHRWLDDENRFPRSTRPKTQVPPPPIPALTASPAPLPPTPVAPVCTPSPSQSSVIPVPPSAPVPITFCALCGHASHLPSSALKLESHTKSEPSDLTLIIPPDIAVCPYYPLGADLVSRPIIPIASLLAGQKAGYENRDGGCDAHSGLPRSFFRRRAPVGGAKLDTRLWTTKGLLGAVDPRLVMGVRGAVARFGLPAFRDTREQDDKFALGRIGAGPDQVQEKLAPHALLALLLNPLLKHLVANGISALRAQRLPGSGDGVAPAPPPAAKRKSRKKPGPVTVLTRNHMLLGMRESARSVGGGGLGAALWVALGRLGKEEERRVKEEGMD